MTMVLWLAVVVGSGTGAVLRYVVDTVVVRLVPFGGFVAGTLVVNVSGSLLAGVVAGVALPTPVALVAGTVVIGSYTTFSTWMAHTVQLADAGRRWAAALNVGVSLAAGWGACALGWWVVG